MVLKSALPDIECPKIPIAQLALEKMKSFGNKIAVVDPYKDQSWTFTQLYEQSIEMALKLRSIGVKKNDFVELVLDFHPKSFPILVALALCKAVAVCGNVNDKAKSAAKQIIQVGAKFCICESSQLKQKLMLEEDLKLVEIFSLLEVQNLVAKPGKHVVKELLSSEGVDLFQDTLYVTFTSGSTGKPKGVVNTNANFLEGITLSLECFLFQPGDCILTLSKQLNTVGYFNFFVCLIGGIKHVVTMKLSPNIFCKCVTKYSVNGADICDFITMRQLAYECNLERNSSLKFIMTSGSTMPTNIFQTAKERLNVIVTQNYGLSECFFISLTVAIQTPLNSSGMLCPNVQLKVLDVESGVELGPGKHGELCVKSKSCFKGYLHDQKATDAVMDECGWLRTGDVGYYDEDRYVYVIDRLKNSIKSFGNMSIFPLQLEAVLSSHPGVAEAAVVRTHHETYNEAAKAFVVKKDPSLTKESLLCYFNAQVAEYQQLSGGLEFIDQIPRVRFGKPNRRALEKL